MEILETIPIYGPPDWPVIIVLIGIGLGILCCVFLNDTKYAGAIVMVIAFIVILIGGISCMILRESKFYRNEYIVRITDMPAQEFVEKYEVTKHFEYSDVFQIKEIKNK